MCGYLLGGHSHLKPALLPISVCFCISVMSLTLTLRDFLWSRSTQLLDGQEKREIFRDLSLRSLAGDSFLILGLCPPAWVICLGVDHSQDPGHSCTTKALPAPCTSLCSLPSRIPGSSCPSCSTGHQFLREISAFSHHKTATLGINGVSLSSEEPPSPSRAPREPEGQGQTSDPLGAS